MIVKAPVVEIDRVADRFECSRREVMDKLITACYEITLSALCLRMRLTSPNLITWLDEVIRWSAGEIAKVSPLETRRDVYSPGATDRAKMCSVTLGDESEIQLRIMVGAFSLEINQAPAFLLEHYAPMLDALEKKGLTSTEAEWHANVAINNALRVWVKGR